MHQSNTPSGYLLLFFLAHVSAREDLCFCTVHIDRTKCTVHIDRIKCTLHIHGTKRRVHTHGTKHTWHKGYSAHTRHKVQSATEDADVSARGILAAYPLQVLHSICTSSVPAYVIVLALFSNFNM